MGSEVQLERYNPGYCSTRELGEEASSHAWNIYDREYHGTSVDMDSERDKDGLKHKMLEHDAVFRRQVSELHRIYRTQRDLMDEMKRSENYNHHRPISLNPLVNQRQDSSKLHSLNFPSSNSACTSPSILGAEHSSPNLSFLKRKSLKNDFLSAKDVDNDCEIIECRPGKVKRKMFDLQLSADAYMDHNELQDQSIDLKARISSNCRNGQSFFGGTSSSTSKRNGMKDLNEPIQIEDDPPTFDFMSRRTSEHGPYTKPFSLQTTPKDYSMESSLISRYGGDYIDSKKQLLADIENKRVQASYPLSIGQFNTKATSLPQYFRPESSHKPSQFIHGKNGTSYGTSIPFHPDQPKEKFWKDGILYTPKFAEIGHESQIRSLNYPSDVKCWPTPVTSREKYGCNSSKKQPQFISSAGLSKSSQASNQPSMIFGEKLSMNSGYVVGIPRINVLDQGSSSGSKEESVIYPSVKFESPVSFKNRAGLEYSKGVIGFDLNRCDEMGLSASAAIDSHHETAKVEQSKHVTLLPWMKPKPFDCETNLAKFLNKLPEPASHDHGLDWTKSTADHNIKKIRGFPTFVQPMAACSVRLSEGNKSEADRNLQGFDMNMPCVTESNTEEISNKVTSFKNCFDLNSCLIEDEDLAQSASSVVRCIRGIDLEAPAPHDVDDDDTFLVTQRTPLEAEIELVAAEAMVSFSSIKKSNITERVANAATDMDTLEWFVGIVSSYPSDLEQNYYEYPLDKNEEPIMKTSSDESDYFEQMTLNLTEMTEEESMPKNAFPTVPSIDEEPVNVIVSARPRRGQARRGRPKRDFQRDILPGLTSLSRHEVTEDLQALDGLMRSSGHAWQFGKRAATRNKPKRGRPRTVNIITPVPVPEPIPIYYPPPKHPQTYDCIGAGIEERNLTGWGKTTRRPRRQRCPAGNIQPVRLS